MRDVGFDPMPLETMIDRNSNNNNNNNNNNGTRRRITYPQIAAAVSFLLLVGVTIVMPRMEDRKPFRPTKVTKEQQPNTLLRVVTPVVPPPPEQQQREEGLSIAWLMSFPNSGTSFTSKLVRHVTKGSTASNYGHEAGSVMVPSMFTEGSPPFWIDPQSLKEWTRPTSLVLTKTHCGGRCEMCGPSDYIENPHSFLTSCLSGHDKANETASQQYDAKLVRKAVHLIRSPVANIVSRFHLEVKHRDRHNFTSDRQGFLSFCKVLDEEFGKEERNPRWLNPQVYEIIKHVPCFVDFVRYVQWHNLAFVVTQSMRIPRYVLFYETFEDRFNETVEELLDFLEVPRAGEVVDFVVGKEYRDYFTEKEHDAIREGVKRMALSTTWDNVKHYFD